MNILITGGTGFIGVELITNLIRNNYNITVLTRQLNKSSTNKAIKFVNNTSQINLNTIPSLAMAKILYKEYLMEKKDQL